MHPQIWIAPLDPLWRQTWHFPPNDWDELFQDHPAWPETLKRVSVFSLSKRFIMEAQPEQLKRVIDFLRDREIKLAIQGTPVLATQTCGLGVEGHGPAGDMAAEAKRIHDLGGTVSYIMLDEPLFYDRFLKFFPWKGDLHPCDYSIEEIAVQAADKIEEVRKIFPSVIVGDIEPFGLPSSFSQQWRDALTEWAGAFQHATGQPFGFLLADVLWKSATWKEQLRSAVDLTGREHLPIGIIYNAARNEPNWTAAAQEHATEVEDGLKIKPDMAVFMSWTDDPRRLLPESDPLTLTGLAYEYIRARHL